MEKFFKFLFLGAFALFAFASCSDDENDVVTPDTPDVEYDEAYYAAHATVSSSDSQFTSNGDGGAIAFKTEGGSVVVNVDCGTEWTAQNNASDTFGCSMQTNSITVTAEQNLLDEELTGSIVLMTVPSGIQFATITITQNAYGAPEITVDTDEWTFPAVSTTQLVKEIGVNATLGTWEVENTAGWLTVQNTESSVILTAVQNDDPQERTTKITLTTTDGIKSDYATISVYQDARASIILDKGELTFSASGETMSVNVEANYEWNFSYDTSNGWFKAEKDGNSLVVTTTADNKTESNYEGTITVTAGDGAENITDCQILVKETPSSSPLDALVLDYTVDLTNLEIRLPIIGTNCTVNWGDGAEETVTTDNPSHTYATAGDYVVRITGTVTGLSTYEYASSSNHDTVLTAVEQWGHTGLTTMEYAFRYCSNLTTIPADSDGAFANVTGFEYSFNGTGLTAIPEGLFDYATNCKNFRYTFMSLGITSIPDDLFRYNTAATDFSSVFRATKLPSIPEDVFKYNVNAELMEQVFYGTPITEIPAGVFANCPKVTSFSDAFETCSSLTIIPEDLFANNTLAENFKACFYSCKKLTTIPAGLFRNNIEATNFQSCFAYNNTLTIPNGLFKNCVKAEDFGKLFQYNGAIIWEGFQNDDGSWTDEGLFTNTAAKDFSYMFYGTENETVPANLFKGCTQATNFDRLFYSNLTISEIPEGLFDDCIAAESFNYTFRGTTALTDLPVNMLKSCTKATSFTQAFRSSTKLTCESPYDVWEINGVETHIHLYERENYPDLYTAPTSHSSCFGSCTLLTDYSSIPSGWK